ncbi:hypothetical protein [Kineosporia succinea]|uniref:Ig-like domain-containing protein n=1 Tax=Kineosporia succinea TaxID=84632 RepID=A0ABT9P780_9ACTN|nr:hypothetical protein [Kineosporia succinea]MDP9828045.1 hypothetical protein [Kineosporia succinea]
MIEVGDLVPLTCKVTRPDTGALSDPGDMRLVVTLPDGLTTLSSPADLTVEHPSIGLYTCDVPTTVAGLHSYRWIATGVNSGVQADVYNVEADGPRLVSLVEAQEALRGLRPCTSAADLERLRWYVLVASRAVELDLNRVLTPRTITEVHQTGGSVILRQGPAQQILSVDVDGIVADPGTYRMRTDGIVETRYGWTTSQAWGAGRTTITYRAGDMVLDPVVRKMCLSGIKRMWLQAQQTPSLPPEDIGAEDLSAIVQSLTPLELDAYFKLRRLAIA